MIVLPFCGRDIIGNNIRLNHHVLTDFDIIDALADFARSLAPREHYEVAPDGRTVNLTDDGLRAVEAAFPGRDLFGTDAEFLVSLNLALYAHAVLSGTVTGPVNAVGPVPVTAREFAATLGSVLRRPALVPVPAFGPRLLLGSEGADQLALASQRVSSAKAEGSGYEFRQPTLEDALRHVLGAA